MYRAVCSLTGCPFIRLSICLLLQIVSKWLNMPLKFFHHPVRWVHFNFTHNLTLSENYKTGQIEDGLEIWRITKLLIMLNDAVNIACRTVLFCNA